MGAPRVNGDTTAQPSTASIARTSGTALSSGDVSGTARCARTKRASRAHARTPCHGRSPALCARRSACPSSAITCVPRAPARPCVHAREHRSHCSGSRAQNTRPTVSWDGSPCGRSRNVANQSAFAAPNPSLSTPVSAPQRTPHSALVRIASTLCRTPRVARGSARSSNCATLLRSSLSTSAFLLALVVVSQPLLSLSSLRLP